MLIAIVIIATSNKVCDQTVERERRSTSNWKQRFLAAATLTVTFVVIDAVEPQNRMPMQTNPYASSFSESPRPRTAPGPVLQILRMVATATSSVGLTIVLWVGLVMLLDSPFLRFKVLWAGTLWVSAIVGTGFVAHSRYAVRPVLVCTVAFGIFSLTYMVLEGPIFGNISMGGAPGMTRFVTSNFVCLPLGVFAAADTGVQLGRRYRPIKCDAP